MTTTMKAPKLDTVHDNTVKLAIGERFRLTEGGRIQVGDVMLIVFSRDLSAPRQPCRVRAREVATNTVRSGQTIDNIYREIIGYARVVRITKSQFLPPIPVPSGDDIPEETVPAECEYEFLGRELPA